MVTQDPTATHTYQGDESLYQVRQLPNTGRNGSVQVRILGVIEGPGSIPDGEIVRVPRRRLDSIGGESL